MYAWEKEGILYHPASVYPSRHPRCIHESAYNIFPTTTGSIRLKTVMYYDDAQYSDVSMLWKNQFHDPTENDTSNDANIIRWHSFAAKKQCCNVDNDAIDSCGKLLETQSRLCPSKEIRTRTNGSKEELDYRYVKLSSPWNIIYCV
jgi:hypothetical protein